MMSWLQPALAAALLLTAYSVDAAATDRWNPANRITGPQANGTTRGALGVTGRQANGTTRGALGVAPQSLKPSPGEIRGLGSRYPEIGVAPGTAGAPKYYPRAMRPIEPE